MIKPGSLGVILLIAITILISGNDASTRTRSRLAAQDAPRGGPDALVSKTGRVFSLFNVVRFPNDACSGTSDNFKGVCLTSTECTAKVRPNT